MPKQTTAEKICVIVGVRNHIVALNPQNGKRLRIKTLDQVPAGIHASNDGIYHAQYGFKDVETRKDGRYGKPIVIINNSVSGNYATTIEASDRKHHIHGHAHPTVRFVQKEKGLAALIGHTEKQVFSGFNGTMPEGVHPYLTKYGSAVYLGSIMIADFGHGQRVDYAQLVSLNGLAKLFKKDNPARYKKNKEFFE